MTMRTTTSIVTFRSPFTLPGWDATWPAGDYDVTIDEEPLDTSFPAYRRISTTIVLKKGGTVSYVVVSPADLAAALGRDEAGEDLPPATRPS